MIPDPSLMLQTAVRDRLIAFPGLTALVPPSAIHDAWRRPEALASIMMGEGQTVLDDRFIARNVIRVFLDLHAWTKGAATAPAKAVTGAIGAALAGPAPTLDAGRCIDFCITHTRHLRDPGNEWGHSVVTVEALVELPL